MLVIHKTHKPCPWATNLKDILISNKSYQTFKKNGSYCSASFTFSFHDPPYKSIHAMMSSLNYSGVFEGTYILGEEGHI